MTDKRLKELVPDIASFKDDRGLWVYNRKPVRKQTENLRKAVIALETAVKTQNDLFNFATENKLAYPTIPFMDHIELESVLEDITGIPYSELGE